MAAEKKQPLPIFLGASLALTVVTFLGVYFGGWITKYIPENIFKIAAGVLFIAIGLYILKDIFTMASSQS